MSPNNKKQDAKPLAAFAASSPPKKYGPRPSRQTSMIARSNNPTLTVYAFANDIPIEAVTYCKDDHDDGYTHPLKQFLDHKLDILTPALIQADFSSYRVRRVPQSNNVEMLDSSHKYKRYLFVRYVPGGGGSTPATRAEALEVLAAFFKDSNYFKYPPAHITTIDGTNVDNPHSLDQFFMDDDIIEFLRTEFAEDHLNGNFFANYPILSRKLWAGQNYPEFARSIGFP
jgi:hypothetical protein